MATFLRRGFIVLMWGALFFSSYFLMSNRSEEDLQRLQKALTTSQVWQSYRAEQTLTVEEQVELTVRSISQENPRLVWVSSRSRITDTEDFEFEPYFQGDQIFVHTVNTDFWNKADESHPVAGELAGLKDPMAFWLRLLPHAAEISQLPDNGYRVELHPFRDELHGVMFQDVESAVMLAYLADQQFGIKRLELELQLKPNILRGYNKVHYVLTMSPLVPTEKLELPEEASQATPLRQ